MKHNLLIVLATALFVSCNTSSNNEPWKEIFNEKDLKGWHQVGGEAKYVVSEGAIVGTTALNTPNSFLVSDEKYGDFILELEFKVDEKLNSGVQIRSNSYPDYKEGRFHGYQVEIDPDPIRARFWTGGIYDESRRGWIYPLSLNDTARFAFKNNEWNKMRIEAIGKNIKTFINDIAVSNLWDDLDSEGFIGLQVHSIGNDSTKNNISVSWKNIKIITENVAQFAKESDAPENNLMVNALTEKEIASGWKLLFDGVSTNGWKGAFKDSFPKQGWTIKDGVITVLSSTGGESTNGGDIVTQEMFAAFDLRVDFKITPGANSGIKYFVTEKEKPSGSAHGLEFQILDDKLHPDGEKFTTVPGSRTLASLYDVIKAEKKQFRGVDEWNTARVIVYPNNHVEHWLNGVKVLEYQRGDDTFKKLISQSKYAEAKYNENGPFGEAEMGRILLQDHGNEVSFRSIKIQPLK